MSHAAVNFYKADLRSIQFTLFEHCASSSSSNMRPFSHLSRDECDAIIEQCLRFVTEVTGPLNGPADRPAAGSRTAR